MIFLAIAPAGDEDYDTFDPLAYKPGRPNIVDTPLDQVLDYTEVAFEGHIVEARKEIWMGPAGNIGMMVLRVAVDQELLLVPAVPGAFYFQYSIDGMIGSTRFQSSPTARVSWAEGPDGAMLPWEDGVAALRVAIQATSRTGSTVPGVTP